jgi:benzoyl-CoA reductase/2-hydroxyglutaryl-CoA dehydratase subunit BcrC/BadD/HgdB
MIKEHQIQGAIYHVLRGCLVYDYEHPVLEEELEKEVLIR